MRIPLSLLFLGLTASVALAADLPSRRAPPLYVPPPPPPFSWSGFYIGANAGYAFDNHNQFLRRGPLAGVATTSDDGFVGGGQIGYNYDLGDGFFGGTPFFGSTFGHLGGGHFVAGVEADIAYTDLRNNTFGTAGYQSRMDYIGTARGRYGLALDRLLIYGTGGFAYGNVRNTVTFAGAGGGTAGSSRIQSGYAYGGGAEYAIPTTSFVNVFNASAVTIKVEYLRYNLGSDVFAVGGSTVQVRETGNLIRGGINYKFGSPTIPVMARY